MYVLIQITEKLSGKRTTDWLNLNAEPKLLKPTLTKRKANDGVMIFISCPLPVHVRRARELPAND